jgi:hypothetical protein
MVSEVQHSITCATAEPPYYRSVLYRGRGIGPRSRSPSPVASIAVSPRHPGWRIPAKPTMRPKRSATLGTMNQRI